MTEDLNEQEVKLVEDPAPASIDTGRHGLPVYNYRLDMWHRMGYDTEIAEALARSSVCLEDARKLFRLGATKKQALLILWTVALGVLGLVA